MILNMSRCGRGWLVAGKGRRAAVMRTLMSGAAATLMLMIWCSSVLSLVQLCGVCSKVCGGECEPLFFSVFPLCQGEWLKKKIIKNAHSSVHTKNRIGKRRELTNLVTEASVSGCVVRLRKSLWNEFIYFMNMNEQKVYLSITFRCSAVYLLFYHSTSEFQFELK